MRQSKFGDFCDKKKRENIRQLRVMKKLLEHSGLKVDNFLDSDDHEPYIFCNNPTGSGSFNGVRIYKVGDNLAFRIQKESKTHPYGLAYPLPIEDMFHDFMSDEGIDEEKAGKKIIESVGKEIKKFFEKSSEAEQKILDREIDRGGDVLARSTGTDYSALITSKS